MNLYKVDFTLEPRKVLKFKEKYSKKLTEYVTENLCEAMAEECIFKLEESFNSFSVLIVSEKEIPKDYVTSVCEKFDTEDVGMIHAAEEDISFEDALNLTSLSNEDKDKIKSIAQNGISQIRSQVNATNEVKNDESKIDPKPLEKEDVFSSIENLVGVDEFKMWAKKMKDVCDKNIPSKMLSKTFLNMSYLVSVNMGNGSSTIFECMGKVIAKILKKSDSEVIEYKNFVFSEDDKKGTDDEILGKLKYFDENGDKLYVVAVWTDNLLEKRSQWLKFLTQLWEKRGKAIFVFAAPYLENTTLNDMHNIIEDIMPNNVLSIKPMGVEDYIKIFDIYFKKADMKVSENVHSLIPEIIAQEKADGRFYGINTINKVCDEIAYNKIANITSGDSTDLNSVCYEDVKYILNDSDDEDNEETGMEKLNKMVSLGEVKQKIKEIIASVTMQKKLNPDSPSSMHMMFSGSPGTGKTVVARLIGQIFRENKILSLGGFYEVSRKDLVGRYIGSTAPKTAEMCKLAYGGVLFIDEAYLLDGGGDNDYGKEAIGTLIAEMENKRGDLVVIFAGYEKDLQRLFELNPGLRDRIPYRISFPNYNREELKEIFYKMLPKKFSYNCEFKAAVDEYFDNFPDEILNSQNFSNGRYVRNLMERVMSKASLRMQLDETSAFELVKSDFILASSDGEFSELNTKKVKKIGFGF